MCTGLEAAAIIAVVGGLGTSTYSAIEQNKLAKDAAAEQKKIADETKAAAEKTGVQQTSITGGEVSQEEKIRRGIAQNLKARGVLTSTAATQTVAGQPVKTTLG